MRIWPAAASPKLDARHDGDLSRHRAEAQANFSQSGSMALHVEHHIHAAFGAAYDDVVQSTLICVDEHGCGGRCIGGQRSACNADNRFPALRSLRALTKSVRP
jgi:hypothetical protein